MTKLTELPTTPDGLPVGANGLPMQFRSESGGFLSGRDVVEAMRIGRILEAINRKPTCGSSTFKEATVLPPIRAEIRGALSDFVIHPKRHDPLADFDINPRKRN